MSAPEVMSAKTLRIIDANLDRIGEGLRVLEDIARFILNDTPLNQQLKNLRHDLIRGDLSFHRRLLQARDARGDVGIDLAVNPQSAQRDLPSLVIANARRVQESLRVLEEMAKLPQWSSQLDSERFKHARFALYSIEQTLLFYLLRLEKTQRLSGLYVIIDTKVLEGRPHLEVAEQVIQGGARIIQLRDKQMQKGELLTVARELQCLCTAQEALFIINDYLDIALAADADGLHLGQGDLPLPQARELLPEDKILGYSTTSRDEAVAAQAAGADYIAVGSIYPTLHKKDAVVVGLQTLAQIKRAVAVPLVAIGGISADNAAAVITAGADAIAVIGAVLQAQSIEEAARQLTNIVEVVKSE